MGYIVKVACHACGYAEDFRLGQGRQDGDLDRVLHYFSDEEQQLIERYKQEEVIMVTFNRELGYCSTCKKLQVMPVLNLYTKADHHYRLVGKCGTCASALTSIPTSEAETDLLCLECQREKLTLQNTGLWD